MKGFLMLGIWIVIIIVVAYVVFTSFLFVSQAHYVYYPERVLSSSPSNIGLDFESVLFEMAREPKKFLEISGTHNEGFITSDRQYEEGLNAFILEHVKPKM